MCDFQQIITEDYFYVDRTDRTSWFDPKLSGRIMFPFWREAVEYLHAIRRAPLSGRTRAKCYLHVLRWVKYHSTDLAHDVIRSIAAVFSSHRKPEQSASALVAETTLGASS